MIFEKCKTLLGYAFCAALPPLASIVAVSFLLDSSLNSYWPVVSDDVSINHQIRTFAYAGFSGGYYTIDEVPAVAFFSRFGPHGPFYPALYGSLLRLFEPSVYGPIWLNHLLIFIACICSFLIARVSVARAFSVGIVTATFWPAICMQTASMQEALHFTVSILGAGLAFRTTFPERAMAWGLFCMMSVIRPTWALATVTTGRRPAKLSCLAIQALISVALSVLAFLLFLWVSAPTPSGIANQALAVVSGDGLETKATSIAIHFLGRTWTNLAFVFRPSLWQPLEGEVFLTSGFVVLFALIFANRGMQASCFALVLAFLALMILYDAGNYRGFRVLAPFTLLAITLGALSENRLFAMLVVSLNLLFAPTFVQFYSENRIQMFDGRISEFKALAKKISDRLSFDPSLHPWCNTVLIDHTEVGSAAIAIPPGFGISVTAGLGSYLAKPKSAFVWVSNENRDRVSKQAGIYEPILEIGDTVILLNKDSACFNGREGPSVR